MKRLAMIAAVLAAMGSAGAAAGQNGYVRRTPLLEPGLGIVQASPRRTDRSALPYEYGGPAPPSPSNYGLYAPRRNVPVTQLPMDPYARYAGPFKDPTYPTYEPYPRRRR